jgi:iron complex outermembrane receptor protein
MRPKNSRLIIVLLLAGFFTSAAAAADKTETDQEKKKQIFPKIHEKVLVTATMTRQQAKDLSSSVSVVEQADIQAIPAANAMTLLNHFPGIFVSGTGHYGRADANIRGLGERGRKIAVLIDGRPEKMSLFGCTITHTFPVDNIRKIEVVRGPASVLYGSDALGGVVNIITRMPEDGFETDISASYGTFSTGQFTLRHGGRLNRFQYYLTLDRSESNGHRAHSDYAANTATAKVRYVTPGGLELNLQGKYYDGRKHEAGTIDMPDLRFWNDYQRGAVDLTLRQKTGPDEYMLKLYRNFGRHVFSDGWYSKDRIDGGVLRCTTHRFTNNELTAGLDFRFFNGRSFHWPQGEWDKSEAALFVRDQYVLAQKWILSAGLRLHYDSVYGTETAPHLGAVYKLSPQTSLRATVNKGFRSPQLNELYMFPPANPELEPERVWNFELGADQQVTDWLSAEASLFHMRGSNLIETRPNPNAPPMFLFMNTGEFAFNGFELGLNAAPHANFSARMFYSYMDPGEKTRGRPGHKLDGSFRFHWKTVSASLNAQYVADYYAGDFSTVRIPNYFLLSGRLGWRFLPAWEIFLNVHNMTDTDYLIYVDLPGMSAGRYPMPGRSLNLGIRMTY